MQRVKSRKSALTPCDQQSLFKFHLRFHEQTEEYARKGGKPWVWYSFDMPDEREMFPPGLPTDLRLLYIDLLKRTERYEGLHQFLADCYPVWHERAGTDPKLQFYMAKGLLAQASAIDAQYREPLNAILYQLGIPDWGMQYLEKSRTTPGLCPGKLPNHDFYGIKAFEQNKQIATWFSTRKLRLVEIFDHRCYHKGNKLGTTDQGEYPEPVKEVVSTPRLIVPGQHTNGRINQPVLVGSLLKGFTQSAA